MKTIFISSFHPAIFRNILATDALDVLLKDPDVRVVVFVLGYKADFFKAQLARPRVIVEGIPFGPPSDKYTTLIFKRLARLALDTRTARVEKRMKWKREGRFFYYVGASLWGKIFARVTVLHRVLRFIDYHLARTIRYDSYFETYKPDLVAAGDVQNERDVELLQAARAKGVRTCGLVRNWDNLTSHGILRVSPDRLIVASPVLREHAMRLNTVSEKRITVTGIVHYDKYVRGPTVSRDDFFTEWKFDRSKRMLFAAVIGDNYIPNNDTDPYISNLLATLGEQIFVRFSPTVPVRALEGAAPPPGMVFDQPGVPFKREVKSAAELGFQDASHVIYDREIGIKDDERLLSAIAYSDMVICGPSTIAMDAIFLDKPVILLNFHPTPRKYQEGIIKYDCDHFVSLMRIGAARMAHSPEELFTLIREATERPEALAAERAKFRDVFCGSKDGGASTRLAHALAKELQ